VLVGLQKIVDCVLVISSIECDVPCQIREKARLIRVVGIFQGILGGGHVLHCFGRLAAPGSDSSLRIFPAEDPLILVSLGEIGLVLRGFVSRFVPLVGVGGVARFKINAGEFVGDLSSADEIVCG
jgi:hypothetical protein